MVVFARDSDAESILTMFWDGIIVSFTFSLISVLSLGLRLLPVYEIKLGMESFDKCIETLGLSGLCLGSKRSGISAKHDFD